MSKNVGVVGIDLNGLTSRHGSDALKASGNNFGNMLFTNAVYKQLKGCEHLGFNFDPAKVNEKFDSIVIPAANWINLSQDWQQLADLIDATALPCTAVGLGAQLSSVEESKSVPKGTRKLLSVLSERSASFGVRGEFTAEVVQSFGINNAEVLGCPSVFYYGRTPEIRKADVGGVCNVGVGPTRYVFPTSENIRFSDKQRQLYQYAIRNASSIYFQSEAFEISVMSREVPNQDTELAKAYYGIDDYEELKRRILVKGRYHRDLEHWISDVKRDDIYIGTRIHGAVAATLAGTPAVLINHDKRTAELALAMCVPSISIEDFEISMLYDLPNFVSRFDFEKYTRRSDLNIKKLARFYTANGLQSIFGK